MQPHFVRFVLVVVKAHPLVPSRLDLVACFTHDNTACRQLGPNLSYNYRTISISKNCKLLNGHFAKALTFRSCAKPTPGGHVPGSRCARASATFSTSTSTSSVCPLSLVLMCICSAYCKSIGILSRLLEEGGKKQTRYQNDICFAAYIKHKLG